jgi:hypothetical protein
MKTIVSSLFLSVLAIAWGCGQKSTDQEEDGHKHHHETEEGSTQKLYDEVMKVHDEVMPKMNDIYKLKEELKKEMADAPKMVEEKRKAIEVTITQLDSASERMMVWMRNFNPIPDSLGEEKGRKYLEEQKVKVERVKEEMLKAIEEAKALD